MICQNCRPWFSTGRSSEKFIQVLNNISDTLNSNFFFINELKCVNTDIGKGTLMYIIIHHYLIHLFPLYGDRGQLFSSSILPIVPSKPFNVIVQFSHFSLICPLSLNSLKKKKNSHLFSQRYNSTHFGHGRSLDNRGRPFNPCITVRWAYDPLSLTRNCYYKLK